MNRPRRTAVQRCQDTLISDRLKWLQQELTKARREAPLWREYDFAAEDMARAGLRGAVGDPLPEHMTPEAVALITEDPEAFAERVRDCAYAIACEKTAHKGGPTDAR